MRAQQIAEVLEKSEVKNFEHPDEIREFPHGRLELMRIGGVVVGRPPRTRLAMVGIGSAHCQDGQLRGPPFQYHVSGVIRVRMEDGTEFDCHPGRCFPDRSRP